MSKIKDDMTDASNAWGRQIQASLDEHFGRGKVGFCLILATSGRDGSMTFNSSLKKEGMIAFFRELADRLSKGGGVITTIH